MKLLLITCVSVACAIVGGGCSGGDGGTATMPFDPFGTEPAVATGSEPTGGSNEAPQGGNTIAQLCARACARIQATCPGSDGGPDCASDCASTVANFPGCEVEFRGFVSCIATAPITCGVGSITAPSCEAAALVLTNCASQGTGASRAGEIFVTK